MLGLLVEALVLSVVGIALTLTGWLLADPDVLDVVATGDILLSLAIVGSAFLILGALSYLAREVSGLREALEERD